jgi:tetratricopeptide (TPR) repeat protein
MITREVSKMKILIILNLLIMAIFPITSCKDNKKGTDSLETLILETDNQEAPILETKAKLLDDDYGFDISSFFTGSPRENASISLKYYYKALEFYDKGDIDNAISNLESALSNYAFAVYYYHYGVCLMDTQDYENAKKAFVKFNMFSEPEINYHEEYGWKEPYDKLYTFDNNRMIREKYFSHYNLSCIYALSNNIAQSMNTLTEALEWGYPYIDHIFNDPDLRILYGSNDNLEKINAIYRDGFIDRLSGKNIQHQILDDAVAYLFGDDKSVRKLFLTTDDRGVTNHGTYEIKNYQLVIHYDKQDGYRGIEGFSLGDNMVWKNFEKYEKNISTDERIAIKSITPGNYWEEKELGGYNYFFEPAIEFESITTVINKPVPEEIYNLLYATEERYLQKNFVEMLFIHKVNFGIPGGDNYIVLWKEEDRGWYETIISSRICLYSISDKIENRYLLSTGMHDRAEFNISIMENIPGIHIGNIGASVFDCNSDGIDELFSYGFYGMGNYIEIRGYDEKKNEIVNYCDDIGFDFIDKNKGTAPFEFTRYKNMAGFKVYSIYSYYSNIPPANLINNYYAWYFFTWNNETKHYEKVGEYLVNKDGVEFEMKYNIHDYPIEHFEKRIRVELTSNTEGLVDIEEIEPNIDGGRSFKVTIIRGSDKTTYDKMVNFDSEGKIIFR